MRIHVDTASDARGEPAPETLHFDGKNIDVADLVDQWWGEGDRYFKVLDATGNTYILRFDEATTDWELMMFLSKRGAGFPGLTARAVSRSRVPHSGDGHL